MKTELKRTFILLCGLYVVTNLYATDQKVTIEIRNDWDKDKTDEPIVIKIGDLKADFQIKSAVVHDGANEIPSQLDDLNNDHKADELAFVIDIPAKSNKTVTLTVSSEESNKQYPARVYADMKIADRKGKHASITSVTIPGTSDIYNQLYHHGPAFESELVAYRIYFNQKQTVDPYGKFNKGLEVEAGGFYPTDEQLAKGFGDDVLKVNNSCGVGTLKGWDGKKATHIEPVKYRTERILVYGPVRTIVEVEVNEWSYQGSMLNMTNRYTLYAGHRDVQVTTLFKEPLKKEVFCTGVQNIKDSKSFSDHKGLVACWGTDWPVNDTVKYAKETIGLATYIPQKYIIDEVKDEENFLYSVGAENKDSFTYHTMFTSMKETFGYENPNSWFAYVQEWKRELEHPCEVRIK